MFLAPFNLYHYGTEWTNIATICGLNFNGVVAY